MDPQRFDSWTRNRALRLSRRDALKTIGVGGATLLAPRSMAAQSPCRLSVHAETAAGPSSPLVYDGVLQFALDSAGSLVDATFTPAGGAPQPVTGQSTGRAVDFQFELTPGDIVSFSGAASSPVAGCPDTASGVFSGPQPADLGGWQATADTSFGSTSSGSTSQPPLQGSSLACPPPQTTCGQNCCPAGASCTDAGLGICGCPAGTVQCGTDCVPACTGSQVLKLDTCTCGECLPEQSGCESDSQCCGGTCTSGICFTCPGLECGDMGCIDHLTDPFNCGACGNACVDNTGFCLGGVCQCIPDNEPVGSSSSSCCAQTFVSTTGLCGCANIGEWCGSGGECCQTGSLVHCLDDGTGFKTCCRAASSSCTTDAECCFSSASYIPQHACLNGVCGPKS